MDIPAAHGALLYLMDPEKLKAGLLAVNGAQRQEML